MKKATRLIFALVLAMMMCLLFAGCGKSEFAVVINEELNAEITAENAAVDSTGSAGTLTVDEDQMVQIEPDLQQGKITVQLIPSDSAEDKDASAEELMAQGEPAFEKEISGTDASECELAAGDYTVVATVTEKATGSVVIRTEGSAQEGFDMTSLLQQVADSEITKAYEEYLPDKAFANAELFGTEDGKAYVYLNTQEFVILNDRAYEMSGGSGEAIIYYTEKEDGISLDKVEWSADGEKHDKWIEENFPEPYLSDVKSYEAHDGNGFLKLDTKMIAKAEEELGVPVERDNQLEIDTDKGTYQIVKITETGTPGEDDYSFDTETIEKGKLSD